VQDQGRSFRVPIFHIQALRILEGLTMPDAAFPTTPGSGADLTPTEIISVDRRHVACDGGGGTLGHPRVYFTIPDTEVMCPYCSRLFVLKPGAAHERGH
jgi:uncharacterized Zn-finger protein